MKVFNAQNVKIISMSVGISNKNIDSNEMNNEENESNYICPDCLDIKHQS